MKSHGPVSPEQLNLMNTLAHTLDEVFNGKVKPANRKVGFVLLAFNFGDTSDGRVNYISNAKRDEMLTAMKEFIARAEGRYEEPGMKE